MWNKCVINEYFGSFYRSSSLISFSCMTSYSRMPLHLFICTCFTIMYPFKNPFYSGIIIQNYSSNLLTQCFVYTTQVSKPHMSNTGEVFQNLSSENLKRMTAYIKKKKIKVLYKFSFPVNFGVLWMGLKIQYILHSTGTHHMYVITFCVLFVQERNRRLNVEVELTLQMATEAVQDMEQVSQGNCQLLSVHVLLR